MITSIIWFKGVLHPWKWCSRGVYLCNDVICDRKGGATSLVTPDSTGQVPAAVSPRFPPLVFFFFFYLTDHPSRGWPRRSYLSTPICFFHDAGEEERFRYKSSGIEAAYRSLVISFPMRWTLVSIATTIFFSPSFSFKFVSFKILYRLFVFKICCKICV